MAVSMAHETRDSFMSQPTSVKSRTSGRPRKFNEASRPITVTLPERTLRQLATVDADRAKAIAHAADLAVGNNTQKPVEVVQVEKGKAIILIADCPCLKHLPWLRLIKVAPGRQLLCLPSGTPIETLEVALMDILDRGADLSELERAMIGDLRECLASSRRHRRTSKGELIFIDLG